MSYLVKCLFSLQQSGIAILWILLGFLPSKTLEAETCTSLAVISEWSNFLRSPGYPTPYPNNLNCTWVFSVSPGNRVYIQFFILMLGSTSDPSCSQDYVEFRQGSTIDSPLYGKFCGNSYPSPFFSSGNNLLMRFVTDATNRYLGFILQHKGICNVYQNASSGSISTPNYPQFYPTKQDCHWAIEVHPLYEIRLNFSTIHVEDNANCTFDYVEVRAGVTKDSPVLTRYCGLTSPKAFTRLGNLSVRFVSDNDREYSGFHATYTTQLKGTWSIWSSWTPCSVTCHHGNSTRSRMCIDPLPSSDEPYICTGQVGNDTMQMDIRTCLVSNCTPVDGGLSTWSNWSACSVECGSGHRQRTRNCTNPSPQFGGKNCSVFGPAVESETCNTTCPVHGGYTSWSDWTTCSVSCGEGQQERTRNCTNPYPVNGGRNCSGLGDPVEFRSCNYSVCPIDGGYGSWSNWSNCSVECGAGYRNRTRNCTNPVPMHGGRNCSGLGADIEVAVCNMACLGDGGYTPWSNWTACSVTCGEGQRMRMRNCTEPAPINEGKNCSSICAPVQYKPCNYTVCPIHGGYGPWSNWSSCSVECGNGYKNRTRNCISPGPMYGGRNCSILGPNIEMETCNRNCRVDGRYTPWSNWSACSVTCGSGYRQRSRNCTNPEPIYEGRNCSTLGASVESEVCNGTCPVDGRYTSWSNWSECSVTCGSGYRNRMRNCANPEPINGGRNCSTLGASVESEVCNGTCHVDGGYTSWSNWSPCSVTCGSGYRNRTRNCTNPEPMYAGRNCSVLGASVESEICNGTCPVDGGYTSWSNWTACSVTCGSGYRSRTRNSTNPEPMNEGTNCSRLGDSVEVIPCTIPCPVDGGYISWSNCSACSVTCGSGYRNRTRNCTNPEPKYGGRNCSVLGASMESEVCNGTCSVDGRYTSWSNWSECSVTCGSGYRNRTRKCTNPGPMYGGRNCSAFGASVESEVCNGTCQIDGGYSSWSYWSTCSVTCGSGYRNRMRNCTNPKPMYGGRNCTSLGPGVELEVCNGTCRMDGGYSYWSNWSACSVTCGSGYRNRTRNCTNLEPMYGGRNCSALGASVESEICNGTCPVDGGYTHWSNWSACSVTCGSGYRNRTRNCTNPSPMYGGRNCSALGASMESEVCNITCVKSELCNIACAVDGGYTSWSNWSPCSVTCGSGYRKRTRNCTNPEPMYGGRNCSALGASMESGVCNITCRIDGGYTSWSNWSACSVPCGFGHRKRTRKCSNPEPMYEGRNCCALGASVQSEVCNITCPVDGGYTSWSNWSACSVPCGSGYRKRTRNCTNPEPMYGGTNCSSREASLEVAPCNVTCPVDGGYTSWSNWSACSVPCGSGYRKKTRNCTNPEPMYGGTNCSRLGDSVEVIPCTIPCPVNGGYTSWSNWSACSVTCGSGYRNRTRNCTNPVPVYGGLNCSSVGSNVESEECNITCSNETGSNSSSDVQLTYGSTTHTLHASPARYWTNSVTLATETTDISGTLLGSSSIASLSTIATQVLQDSNIGPHSTALTDSLSDWSLNGILQSSHVGTSLVSVTMATGVAGLLASINRHGTTSTGSLSDRSLSGDGSMYGVPQSSNVGTNLDSVSSNANSPYSRGFINGSVHPSLWAINATGVTSLQASGSLSDSTLDKGNQATKATPPLHSSTGSAWLHSSTDVTIMSHTASDVIAVRTDVVVSLSVSTPPTDTKDTPTGGVDGPSFPWYIIPICLVILLPFIFLLIRAAHSKSCKAFRTNSSKKHNNIKQFPRKYGMNSTLGRHESFTAVSHHLCQRDVYYGGPLDYAYFTPRIDAGHLGAEIPPSYENEGIELSCQFDCEECEGKIDDNYEYLEASCVLEDEVVETAPQDFVKPFHDYDHGILGKIFPEHVPENKLGQDSKDSKDISLYKSITPALRAQEFQRRGSIIDV